MGYVIDTNSLSVLGNIYADRFPTFWSLFNGAVSRGEIVSVREVKNELFRYQGDRKHLVYILQWAKEHSSMFLGASEDEARFILDIFRIKEFESLVGEKNRLAGKPVADPFLIAKARAMGYTVVTEETKNVKSKTGPKIPNVCEYFNIPWTNIEGVMAEQKWRF